jgi:hypothetical protein
MKTKLLFICTLLFAMGQSFAQLHVFEPFDYAPVGASILDGSYTNPTTSTIWTDRQGGDDDMLIATDPGWGSDPDILDQAFTITPTGNAIQFQGGGEDAVLPFAAPVNSGSVYMSFFIQVVGFNEAWASLQEYRLIHFGVDNGSGGYNAGSALMVGPGAAANTFKIGYSNSDSTGDAVWFGTEYPHQDLTDAESTPVLNQFFIVLKYTFATEEGKFWVNPAVNTTEPAADLTHDGTAASKHRTIFHAFNIEASSNARTPNCFVDEVRVAGSWEEVTGRPGLSVSKNEILNSVKLYPNPAQDVINIESKTVRLSTVDVYNVLGAKVMSSEILNDRVNVSSLRKGVYFMKINAEEGGSATKKIVIE